MAGPLSLLINVSWYSHCGNECVVVSSKAKYRRWGDGLVVKSVYSLSFLSVTMTNTKTKSDLERLIFIWLIYLERLCLFRLYILVTVRYGGSQWIQTGMERGRNHGGRLAACGWLGLPSSTMQDPGLALPTVGWTLPHPQLITKMPSQRHPILPFPNWDSLPTDISLDQIDRKLTNTRLSQRTRLGF